VAFKGSNFKNADNQYAAITMYTLDVPVLLMFGLTPQNTANVFAGAQYSRILNKALFLKGSSVPESPSPAIHNDDVFAIVGTQFHTPFVGFQIAAKYGLRNLNSGTSWILNPTNTGKQIHQFVFEINLLF
jgi:hypothetical protein